MLSNVKEKKLAAACLKDHDINELSRKVKYIRSLKGFWTDNFKSITKEELASLERERPTTRLLSIHTINGCNLACRACNHNIRGHREHTTKNICVESCKCDWWRTSA